MDRWIRPGRLRRTPGCAIVGRDDLQIVALNGRTLVEEIAVGTPRFQRRLHRWSGDRLVEEA
jgi:hypothetical protein